MNTFIIFWSIAIGIMFLISMIKKIDLKSEIVSAGVLGTFIGILFSLQHFDVTNIKEALPQILEGMKLAFITSVEAMSASIVLSIFQKVKSKKSNMEIMIDNQNQIIKLLENSASTKSDEFIIALNNIVKQFNSNMIEQFGENFAKLDKTVEKFLDYQKTHQDNIEKLYREMESLIIKSEEINNIYSKLSKNTSEITNEMQKGVHIIEESLSLSLRKANGK